MQLAVSNIAWNESEDARVLELLRELGVQGVEVAPTKLWPEWRGATAEAAAAARRRFEDLGFAVPALQSIVFARPDIQVFGDADVRSAGIAHIAKVAEIAERLGAKVMVFGSPKNRTRGKLSLPEANSRGAEFFLAAGDACAPFAVSLCLEPNPSVYSCDFMTHWQEIREMVDRVNHPFVGIHLDTACMTLANDSPAEAVKTCAPEIRHFHVTEPNLGDFAHPSVDHLSAAGALREVGYDGWLSIEMRRSEDPLLSIRQAVEWVRNTYG